MRKRDVVEVGTESEIQIDTGDAKLEGILYVPKDTTSIILFVHGSGSSRHSTRNQLVATELNNGGHGTLLFDLLTLEEERSEAHTRHLRFDIPLLALRVERAIEWVRRQPAIKDLNIGLFGASTGAAAALIVAARRPDLVRAVVSRGGRPDLAGEYIEIVQAPTLFIVGEKDEGVVELNELAMGHLRGASTDLALVPEARHLFEGPGQMEEVARLASAWFTRFLK